MNNNVSIPGLIGWGSWEVLFPFCSQHGVFFKTNSRDLTDDRVGSVTILEPATFGSVTCTRVFRSEGYHGVPHEQRQSQERMKWDSKAFKVYEVPS